MTNEIKLFVFIIISPFVLYFVVCFLHTLVALNLGWYSVMLRLWWAYRSHNVNSSSYYVIKLLSCFFAFFLLIILYELSIFFCSQNFFESKNILGKQKYQGSWRFFRSILTAETDRKLVGATSQNLFNADKSADAHRHISCADDLGAWLLLTVVILFFYLSPISKSRSSRSWLCRLTASAVRHAPLQFHIRIISQGKVKEI